MTTTKGIDRPMLKLIGEDGNAFNILGLARRAMKKAGWPSDRIADVYTEMTAGDYDHLLATAQKYFDVR